MGSLTSQLYAQPNHEATGVTMGWSVKLRRMVVMMVLGGTWLVSGLRGGEAHGAGSEKAPLQASILAASRRVFALYQGEQLRLYAKTSSGPAGTSWIYRGKTLCGKTNECLIKTSAWGLGSHRLRLVVVHQGHETTLRYDIKILPRPPGLPLGEVSPEVEGVDASSLQTMALDGMTIQSVAGSAYAFSESGLNPVTVEKQLLTWAGVIATPPATAVVWGRLGEEEYFLAGLSQAQLDEHEGRKLVVLQKGALRIRNLSTKTLPTTVVLEGAWLQLKVAASSELVVVAGTPANQLAAGRGDPKALATPSQALMISLRGRVEALLLDEKSALQKGAATASGNTPRARAEEVSPDDKAMIEAQRLLDGAYLVLPAVAALRLQAGPLPEQPVYEPPPHALLTRIVAETTPYYVDAAVLADLLERDHREGSGSKDPPPEGSLEGAEDEEDGGEEDSQLAEADDEATATAPAAVGNAYAPQDGGVAFGRASKAPAANSWQTAVRQAKAALALRDYMAALDHLLVVRDEASEKPAFALALAQAYFGLYLFAPALAALDEATLEGGLAQGEAAALKGQILLLQGESAAALPYLGQALSAGLPAAGLLHYYAGVAHYQLRHDRDAFKNFTYAQWFDKAERLPASQRYLEALRKDAAFAGHAQLDVVADENPFRLATRGRNLVGETLESKVSLRAALTGRYTMATHRAYFATIGESCLQLPQDARARLAQRAEVRGRGELGLRLGGPSDDEAALVVSLQPSFGTRLLGGQRLGDLIGHQWRLNVLRSWGQPELAYERLLFNDTIPGLVKGFDAHLWQPTEVSDRSFRQDKLQLRLAMPSFLRIEPLLALSYTSLAFRFREAAGDSYQGYAVGLVLRRTLSQRASLQSDISYESRSVNATRDVRQESLFGVHVTGDYQIYPGVTTTLLTEYDVRSSPLYPFHSLIYGLGAKTIF